MNHSPEPDDASPGAIMRAWAATVGQAPEAATIPEAQILAFVARLGAPVGAVSTAEALSIIAQAEAVARLRWFEDNPEGRAYEHPDKTWDYDDGFADGVAWFLIAHGVDEAALPPTRRRVDLPAAT